MRDYSSIKSDSTAEGGDATVQANADANAQQQAAATSTDSAAATTATGGDQQQQQQQASDAAATAAASTDANASAAAQQQQAAPPPAATDVKPDPTALTPEQLKALGVNSFEELQKKLNPPVQETPEQIAEKAKVYTANVDNYAITKNIISREELIKLENVKGAEDTQVAYDKFAANFKAGNAEATDESVREAFENLYHLNSQDPTLQQLGKDMLAKEAATERTALQSKYDTAKSQYDDEQTRTQKFPEFKNFITSQVTANVPDKLEILKAGDVSITLELTQADRDEAIQALIRPDVFDEFLKPDNLQQAEADVKNKLEAYLFLKNKSTILDTVYQRGKSEGTSTGSTVGATNSFAVGQQAAAGVNNNTAAQTNDLTQADIDKIRQAKGRRF